MGSGDLITIRMLGLFHPEFCSIAYRNAELWEHELPNLQIADYDRADGLVGYSWMMRYTKAFLDSYLKSDIAATAFLKAQPGMNAVQSTRCPSSSNDLLLSPMGHLVGESRKTLVCLLIG
jgi:hypothetical protein